LGDRTAADAAEQLGLAGFTGTSIEDEAARLIAGYSQEF
jgi:hypothetical protein